MPLRALLFEWGSIQVMEKLGEGGFGEVYRAWDPSLEREVALKLSREGLESGIEPIQQWMEEARRLARVRHPNVIVVHGVDVRNGRAGIWFDLIRGRTLERVLQEQGRLGEGEAVLIGLDLCRALAAVHSARLVHGDLKTTNVMREGSLDTASPSVGRIVLMDFGASRESSPTRRHEAGLATPLSCAPEVLRGEALAPSGDVYSLGVLLYRLVTARYPIEARDWAELRTRMQQGLRTPLRDLRPDLGSAFVAVVERALDPDPTRRFASASEMERGLVAARPEGMVRRKFSVIAVLAALAAMVTLAIVISRLIDADNPSGPIAVLEFRNVADPADTSRLGLIASSLITTGLANASGDVLSTQRIIEIVQGQSGKPGPRDLARAVASRTRASWIVTGSILRTEPNLFVTAELSEAMSGRIIDAFSTEGLNRQSIYDVSGRITSRLALKLGRSESLRTVTGRSTKDQAAYQRYVEGLEYMSQGNLNKAEAAFRVALRRDPEFQLAIEQLAAVTWLQGSNYEREVP